MFRLPPGGHAELGEYALEAAQRELGEEIGQVPARMHLTGVPENSTERDGTARHEISPPPSPVRLPAIHLMRGRSRTKLEPL